MKPYGNYNHQEYIEANRRPDPREFIGKQFSYAGDPNAGMGPAMILYTLKEYNPDDEKPYLFESSWGYKKCTEEEFRTKMFRNTYWENC